MNRERIQVPSTSHRRGRRPAAVLAAIAAALLIAACGSSSGSGGTTTTAAASGSGVAARQAALASCLKQHGVTLPARSGRPGAGGPPAPGAPPGARAGGTPGSGPPGFFGGRGPSAKTQAALKACGATFGGGRRFRQISRTAIQTYVTCVRKHGYNLPNPDFSGKGPTFPASIRTDKAFVAASRSCAGLLRPGGAGAGAGAGAAPGTGAGAPPGTTSTPSS